MGGSQAYQRCLRENLGSGWAIALAIINPIALTASVASSCSNVETFQQKSLTSHRRELPEWVINITPVVNGSVRTLTINATPPRNSLCLSPFTAILEEDRSGETPKYRHHIDPTPRRYVGQSSVETSKEGRQVIFTCILIEDRIRCQFNFNSDLSAIEFIDITNFTQVSIVNDIKDDSPHIIRASIANKLMSTLAKKDQDPFVEMFVQTDTFGCNLSEMSSNIVWKRQYPDGYPKKYIGKCGGVMVNNMLPEGKYQTIYVKRPNLQRVLKGNGSTLLAQTIRINSHYETGYDDCEFFNMILVYSTLRYMFAGLIFGKYSAKWLLRKNAQLFLERLEQSEFGVFLPIFVDPIYGLTMMSRYFRNDLCG